MFPGLYTDESPGLKVDPVVVMTLSVVFIFSVVALHGESPFPFPPFPHHPLTPARSHRKGYAQNLLITTPATLLSARWPRTPASPCSGGVELASPSLTAFTSIVIQPPLLPSYLTLPLIYSLGDRARLGFDGFFERMEKSGRSVFFF